MSHLLETYALASSSKIGKPFINEQFFPLITDKYITFHPTSKEAKSYDFWNECLALLLPVLNKIGISIVQMGESKDIPYPNIIHTQGQTNFAQCAFILKNSLLHLGTDSFPVHISSSYSKKIVALYSNNFPKVVGPYWGNPNDHILLEPKTREKGWKPSFALQEQPKQINTIDPGEIAHSVCKLLNLTLDYPYTQLWLGQFHAQGIYELVPNCNVNPQQIGVQSIVIRMDFAHSEEFLDNQLNICPCSIITKSPITLDLLKRHKSKIQELIYFIDETHCPNFIEEAQRIGLNRIVLASRMKDEELNKLKLYYLELGLIQQIPTIKKENILEIQGIENLYYRTRKFTISKGQIFPSKAAWIANLPITLTQLNTLPIIDNEEFWLEANHFAILKKET